jgi:hypothetical protein
VYPCTPRQSGILCQPMSSPDILSIDLRCSIMPCSMASSTRPQYSRYFPASVAVFPPTARAGHLTRITVVITSARYDMIAASCWRNPTEAPQQPLATASMSGIEKCQPLKTIDGNLSSTIPPICPFSQAEPPRVSVPNNSIISIQL